MKTHTNLYDPDLRSSLLVELDCHESGSALLVHRRLGSLPEEVSASLSADSGTRRRPAVLGETLQTFSRHQILPPDHVRVANVKMPVRLLRQQIVLVFKHVPY